MRKIDSNEYTSKVLSVVTLAFKFYLDSAGPLSDRELVKLAIEIRDINGWRISTDDIKVVVKNVLPIIQDFRDGRL